MTSLIIANHLLPFMIVESQLSSIGFSLPTIPRFTIPDGGVDPVAFQRPACFVGVNLLSSIGITEEFRDSREAPFYPPSSQGVDSQLDPQAES